MLEKIHIKGYRALKDLELHLPAGRPLVLIGENASGKSTILDAIALINATANGQAGQAIKDRQLTPNAEMRDQVLRRSPDLSRLLATLA
ncbi:MAG: AAA family ATPase [Myxococcota bacterium]